MKGKIKLNDNQIKDINNIIEMIEEGCFNKKNSYIGEMDKLEDIKNVFRELDKGCKEYEKCEMCPHKTVCDTLSHRHIPEYILSAIEHIEKELNN